ncbi:MAG: DUF3883 domain-containing protein [Firmicutes bacterium]|nr:DUF3883 domain-containing protein [Bacillota bacterium]
MQECSIEAGMVIMGPMFPEPVRVLAARYIGSSRVKIEAVGVNSKKYYDPILGLDELSRLTTSQGDTLNFTGDGERLFLFLEAHRIRNAFQFDPYYGVSVSQVDALPHQIEAVYHYILKNPNIRFLLADDPGAGKTIMAGLVLKELKYRGLVNRTLIIVPGHLKGQWLREMRERFQENFIIVDRGVMNATWGQNVWTERHQVITSLDFAKQEDVMFTLKDSSWDLVIVDEAHKMSAYKYGDKIDKTVRYQFGELISEIAKYLLFLTATPHRGDPENFRLFLDLLQPGFFANTKMLAESIKDKDNPLFLRRLKEDLKGFDNSPLFPPRRVETIKYRLSEQEKKLYNAVTKYVEQNFNKALQKEKRNVTFALTILQRRLASSIRAVRKSLERRRNRLEELYRKGQILQEAGYSENYLEDLEESQRWEKEEELLEKLTSADSLEELQDEINNLDELVGLAKEAEKGEIETKLVRIKEVLDQERIRETGTKLLIFTESKDTMEYLAEKLRQWGYIVTVIHGGMNMDDRIRAEHEFKNRAQIMVATEAAGEGINLQFCWLMVNYDIPWNPNRLEQRMGRIHRYGQRNEVHIYNLVAVDTREGRILEKLFEKLDRMKEHLGSDRVFDVIGDVLPGTSLKDLILDAISSRRTMEDILAEMERIPDEEAIQKVKEATMEALATRHIDLSRILGEQRTAVENRLVPEYIERFFLRAAQMIGIRVEKRQDGFWRITAIPFEVRNQPYEFKVKYGEVQREYLKVAFDKVIAFKGQAEFVTMGHPLMEAVLETVLKGYRQDADKGAVFIDPDGKLDGLLWFMTGEVKDGKGDVAGRRLLCVYQTSGGQLFPINPSILWDLKPGEENTPRCSQAETTIFSREDVIDFAIEHQLTPYRDELLAQRQRDAEIKAKYGLRSIDSMILESEAKLTEYETRKIKGESIPEVAILQERRRREDLEGKRQRLLDDIRAHTNLYPSEPNVLSVIRVIPGAPRGDMNGDEDIERVGMEVAMEYERSQGRTPEDVSLQSLGYDVRSADICGDYRYIEVKARARTGAIALTPNEWLMANRLGDEYWLYVVENATSTPVLFTLQNPAAQLKPEEEVGIVRYIVKDWREKACVVGEGQL